MAAFGSISLLPSSSPTSALPAWAHQSPRDKPRARGRSFWVGRTSRIRLGSVGYAELRALLHDRVCLWELDVHICTAPVESQQQGVE